MEETRVATEVTEVMPVQPRRRKVNAGEARRIIGVNGHGQNIIETADGRLVIMPYYDIALVLPEEWDLDEWDNPINPLLEYSSNDHNSALLTGTNIDFGKGVTFFWGTVDEEHFDDAERIWFTLCDPCKATYLLVKNIATLTIRKLEENDIGELTDKVKLYRNDHGYSAFLMPVGYIRLNYTTEDNTIHSNNGMAIERIELKNLFYDRSRDSVQRAQDELDAYRAEHAKLVETVQRALSESKRLAPEITKLRERCRKYEFDVGSRFKDDEPKLNYFLPGEFNFQISPWYGYRLCGLGQSYECSEDGIKKFNAFLEACEQKFESHLKDLKEQADQNPARDRFTYAAHVRRIPVTLPGERGRRIERRLIKVRFDGNMAYITMHGQDVGSSGTCIPINEENYAAYCKTLDDFCRTHKERLCDLLCAAEGVSFKA